jgi:glycosyltransferase involved in cell wall biosynthesis
MNELVTIGIPTYNRLHYLKEAVASALAQTYPNIEVLISQNPHKDESITQSISTWCQEIASQNPKVRHQLNSRNNGSPANFNAIADAAWGEYIAFIGDDDRLLPNFVEKLVNIIPSDASLAFCNHYLIDSVGRRMEKESYQCTQKYYRDRLPAGEVSTPRVAAWQSSLPFEASLIRTKDFQRLRFKEQIGAADTEFFIRIAEKGGRFFFLPDYLSEVRIHEQRSTAAGLQIETLVAHLLPVNVSPEIEVHKRELLSRFITGVVTNCLLTGDIEKAKEYMSSGYYLQKGFKGRIQKLCTRIPKPFGYYLYKIMYMSKKYQSYLKKQNAKDYGNIPEQQT